MRNRLLIVTLLVMLLLLLSASQALAAPTFIQASAAVGYISGDCGPAAGFEAEFISAAYVSFLYSAQTQTIIAGYRYYIPVDEPFRISLTIGELLRVGTYVRGYASYIAAGFDYDPGWYFATAELGAGVDMYEDVVTGLGGVRPLFIVQLKAGIHYHF